MSLHIRRACVEDAAAMLAVLNPIIEARCYTVLDAPFTLAEQRAFIEAFPKRGVFHVAERGDDGEVVGFQDVEPFASYTHAFDHVGVIGTFVRLDCLREGVGRALFASTFAAARDLGYEKLFTFIRADNLAARAAYASQGFREIGVASRHAKIDGAYVDEIMVELFL
ncbi:GNAT family N-acetyltransferase [Candidatus Poribacteria bacterium]|jgi:L-amino acid N-acyltransferase YncA|nr:GNAT family N-acetyltransferase [Candidatus Poribacteria bacterium]MBT5533633.1 GNAT family N-acetyltransferase [Candidatus Poribacteria bacterium]MBT5713283.1 GNAT family N-acetyltransferase [Candidatus Poribacteria bacterium]MBT7097829.1 GNAT family N-acetyltransferase [Candidatus Poribacteria bacterium]MBT7805943.1 GNAT family N-acetyltransferase [Candidatus Poribacteria bacterium]